MKQHDFIFKPGVWIGEGRMIFSSSPEPIRFYTKWHISPIEQDTIVCRQAVEMQGVEEHVKNAFRFYDLVESSFSVELDNELFGTLVGKGIIDPKIIAWEFRLTEEFEGFEVYELQENGELYGAR